MKLVTFTPSDGEPRAGVVIGDVVVDLAAAAPLVLEESEHLTWSMLDLLRAHQPDVSLETAEDIVRAALSVAGRAASATDQANPTDTNGSADHGLAGALMIGGAEMLLPLSQVLLHAPLPNPVSLRLFDGLHGYWHPVFHFGNHTAIVAPAATVPAGSSGSLAVFPALTYVLGQGGRDIDEERALNHVALLGIALLWYNPLLLEEARSLGITLTKAFDFAVSCGACLITPDELELYTEADGHLTLDVRLRVNAVERWHNNLIRQHYPIPVMIAHASRGVMLYPGEMLLNFEVKPLAPILLKAGDQVELEVTGMGTLMNTVG